MFKITHESRLDSISKRLIFFVCNRLFLGGLAMVWLLTFQSLKAQNALIGTGFGTNDWTTSDCFLSNAASTRERTFTTNGTGDRYFRLTTCWDGNFTQWGPSSTSVDYLVSIGVKVPNSEIVSGSTSKAYYIANGNTSHRYVFKTGGGGNPPASPRAFVVFQIEGSDVRTVSSVSRSPSSTVYPGETTTITATLSGTFFAGQAVFLRYSNSSSFTSSTVVKMTGSGTSYTANIPSSANGASQSVFYYVFTSGDVASIAPEDADLFSINLNNNGGSNYSYTVASSWSTAASGNWNSGSSWQDGRLPVSAQPISIGHNVALNTDYVAASVSISSGSTLTVNSGQTLTTQGAINGPGSLDVSGTLQINPGGFVGATLGLTYNSGSTLAYNTGGSYGSFREWTTNSTTAAGVPWNVNIINSNLNFTDNNPTQYRHVRANLTVGASATLTLGSSVGGDLLVAGDFTLNGSLVHNSRMIEFMGSSNSTLNGGLTLDFFKVNKSAGASLTLNANLTVNNTLWLDAGRLTTGSNVVIAPATITRTAGWVHGNLRRNIPIGSDISSTFDLGDATTYNPATFTFASVSAAGSLTVSTENAVLPTFSSSPLNQTLYVERNWKMSQIGITFTSYTATLNFQTADLTSTASPTRLIAGLYTTSWSLPAVASRASTSTQLTGLTAVGNLMLADGIAEVSSPASSTVGSYSALLSGNVASGTSLLEVGMVWSASTASPTVSDNKVVASGLNSTGSFSVAVSQLPENTTLHYRVFATNSFGTSYSTSATFTTGLAKNYTLINGQSASLVLGQLNFNTNTAGVSSTKFNNTRGVAIDWVNNKVYVADALNHRVLRYSYPLSFSSLPEVVFGQPDFTSNSIGLSDSQFNTPIDVEVDNMGRLWVVDALNKRVLWFNQAHSIASNQPSANGVLGQDDFDQNLSGCSNSRFETIRAIDLDRMGNLYVADYGNNRVLRFDRAANKPNGGTADGVFGQADFNSNSDGVSHKKLKRPSSVTLMGTTLWVTDQFNHRTLRFDQAHLATTDPEATVVLGQPNFTVAVNGNGANQQRGPFESHADSKGTLWVMDAANHRLLAYHNALSKSSGAAADAVIGQEGFGSNLQAQTDKNLKQPRGIAVHPEDLYLVVSDGGNNRILGFEGKVNPVVHGTVSSSAVGAYSAQVSGSLSGLLISESGFVWSTSNPTPTLADAKVVASGVRNSGAFSLFLQNLPSSSTIYFRSYAINPQGTSYSSAQQFTTATAPDFNLVNGQSASIVVGQTNFTLGGASLSSSGFSSPRAIAIDQKNGKLYVADFANHRVLRFSYPISPLTGATAEIVFGQPNFTSNTSGTAANRFNNPVALALDNQGRLWVSDFSNNRVVWFDDAHSISSNEPSANGVLGDLNFGTRQYDMPGRLQRPVGLCVDELGNLWVADSRHNRVLKFNHAATKTNGAYADLVLGQSNFSTIAAATSQNQMSEPTGVTVVGNTLFVTDKKNNRLLRFDNIQSKTSGANADGVLGQSNYTSSTAALTQNGMNQPISCSLDAAGTLWVAENANRRVLAFHNAASLSNGSNASLVIGQASFTSRAVTLSSSRTATNFGVSVDAERLYMFVADMTRNRVLGFKLDGSSSSRTEAPELDDQAEDLPSERNLTIYPNPSNGLFRLRFDFEQQETFELSIFDAAGRLILSSSNRAQIEKGVDLSEYDKGLYFAKFSTSLGYEVTLKLVIE